MQTVVDFLLEYYIWVLAVLVILLITVVGYLADTKKKKKLREKADLESNNMNQMPTQDMGMQNNMNFAQPQDMMTNNMNQMPSQDMGIQNNMNNIPVQDVMVNNMNQMPTQDMGMQNNMNNIPVQDVMVNNMNQMPSFSNGTENNNAFFTPISEQKPNFEPREVVIPKPVEPSPIINNTPVVNAWENQGTPTQPQVNNIETQSSGMEIPTNQQQNLNVNNQNQFQNSAMNFQIPNQGQVNNQMPSGDNWKL